MSARPVRLRRRADFQKVTRQAKKRVTPGVILQALRTDATSRIGFTVSKRVGNAVVRNRAKRRLREASRMILDGTSEGYDLVLIGRKDTPTRPFDLLLSDLRRASIELGVVSSGDA